ncbi:serine hydrolase domain-containing protein [Hyphomicrobium sp.]|uniref:serine hydrolase domain-containing protein n=1 Tax=Hyphomicrobium sp. TaxID=82 RepID=UPI002E2F638F|nr:serine hydrolase domain-containing protein [Hyphomicrobium sp.]HEX2842262.1 serine hydrolase domain-containing protein [Hyphomicrobium sp.]
MISEQIATLVHQAVENRIFPGCVLGLVENGRQDVRAFGKPMYESDAHLSESSIYDVASITKTVVTATLMHLLIDAGRCGLTEPVCKYIPEFAANGKGGVLIEHLMSYTVELASAYVDDWKGDTTLWTFPELLQLFYAAPLKTAPGESYRYTDATAILLGELIRRIAGANLDVLAEQRIFLPLGMRDSTLIPSCENKRRIVPTGYRPDGTLLWGIPNDEKAHIAFASGTQSGLAGLFSTVPDILRWIEMVFASGRVNGHAFLSPRAIELMTHDYYPGKRFRSALGWGDGKTYQSLNGAGGESILAKGGYTGCFMVGDVRTKKAVVLLSNRVYPERPENLEPWQEFRRTVVRRIFE